MSLPKLQGPRRTTESRNRMNAEDYKRYLEKNTCEEMEIHYEGTGRDWDDNFRTIAEGKGKLNNNIALEFIESWSPEETNRVGAEELFRRGIKNAREAFPDRSFIVAPHINDNGCFHTHVLFCTIGNNGDRLLDKGVNRRRWNKVCDRTSRENGLSTLDRTSTKQKERLSRAARERTKRGQKSYQHQIMKKADFARRIAVNMNEFISFMGDMGIEVNVRGEHTISYVDGDQKQATRGRRLGLNYKTEGLNEQFKRNENEFKQKPSFRKHLEQARKSLIDERGDIVGDSSNFPFLPGGHQKFEKQGQQINKTPQIHSKNVGDDGGLNSSFFHLISDQIKSANRYSIADYCKKHGIGLNPNKDGSFTLKGREHILINGSGWENLKSKNGQKVGTRGTIIDFVMNHKDVGHLRAISEITGNKGLLVLEQYIGEEKPSYKEFYVPKSKRKNEKESTALLKSLIKQMGFKSDFSRQLYNMKQVQVRTDGVIRLLSGNKAKGAVEFKQEKNGKWHKSLLGTLRSGILKQTGSKKDLKLFNNLFSFIHETNGKGVMDFSNSDNLLVLGDNKMEALDFFLANNPKVKHIELFGFDSKSLPKAMSLELNKRDITFSFMETDARQRNRGLDLSI